MLARDPSTPHPQTQQTSSTNAVSTTANDGTIQLHITLPIGAEGHDVSVVVSPRKPASVATETGETRTPVPQCALPNTGASQSQAVSGDDPFVDIGYTATHLRRAVLDKPPLVRYLVPRDVLCRFPATLAYGWQIRKWYIVWRGREVGIFFDLW
jgi:hypothetical protein